VGIYKCALMVSLGLFKQVEIPDDMDDIDAIKEYAETKSGQANLEKALFNMRKKKKTIGER
jgi:hypothetical protein